MRPLVFVGGDAGWRVCYIPHGIDDAKRVVDNAKGGVRVPTCFLNARIHCFGWCLVDDPTYEAHARYQREMNKRNADGWEVGPHWTKGATEVPEPPPLPGDAIPQSQRSR